MAERPLLPSVLGVCGTRSLAARGRGGRAHGGRRGSLPQPAEGFAALRDPRHGLEGTERPPSKHSPSNDLESGPEKMPLHACTPVLGVGPGGSASPRSPRASPTGSACPTAGAAGAQSWGPAITSPSLSRTSPDTASPVPPCPTDEPPGLAPAASPPPSQCPWLSSGTCVPQGWTSARGERIPRAGAVELWAEAHTASPSPWKA